MKILLNFIIFCEKDVETDKHSINIHCLYPILNYEWLKYPTSLLSLKHHFLILIFPSKTHPSTWPDPLFLEFDFFNFRRDL